MQSHLTPPQHHITYQCQVLCVEGNVDNILTGSVEDKLWRTLSVSLSHSLHNVHNGKLPPTSGTREREDKNVQTF